MRPVVKTIKKSIYLLLITIVAFYNLPLEAQSFQDDLTGEVQGDFPSRWNLIRGSSEIPSLDENPFG